MSGEDTPMDDDALMDGWDAHVCGRVNGLDRLSNQDRGVIEMLHARTWSPTPRQPFASDLRARLTAESTRDQVAAPVVSRPTHQPPVSIGRPAPWRTWQRTALAAVLIAALLASFGGRLADDPPAPTVQAPLVHATTPGAASLRSATPGSADDCLSTDIRPSQIASTFVDADLMPEVGAALSTARHATLQTLVRREAGSVLPDGYDLAGSSGVVVDAVVLGAATASFQQGAWLMAVDSMRFSGVRPVFPGVTVDLLRGDVVVYPIGTLVDLSNALDGRWLEIARLVLHDVEELPSRVTDSITLNTVGRADLDVGQLLHSPVEFDLAFGYVAGQSALDIPGAACRPGTSTLVSGIAQEPPIAGDPDDRPTYGGPFVWISPFVLAPPATPTP